MHNLMCHFEDLPLDVLYEVLGHLPVLDIIRSRQVCRRICTASYQRSVWLHAYERSSLLLPDDSLSSQCSIQLENLLVRATKIHWNWTSPKETECIRRRFPRELPTYDFAANIISGRYLQVAERGGISWYDLDADDIGEPILVYPCETVTPMNGFLDYQVNANGEGPETIWVALVYHFPSRIGILKLHLGKVARKATLWAEIPAVNVTNIKMGHDWVLPIREFSSPDDPMDLFHIPSKTTLYVPMHEKVQHLSDLNNMNFVITPQYLFFLFSLRTTTLVDAYPLPKIQDKTCTPSSRYLVRTHTGIYPHAISSLQVAENLQASSTSDKIRVSFLSLVYVNRSPTTWTSKIGLHLFDADLDTSGTLSFIPQCERTLHVGIATTSLSLTAREGTCLAVTHSSPGPVVLAHYIQRSSDSSYVMNMKSLKLPEGVQSRDMLGFDAIRGRLCLIGGWTNIEILDYA